MLRRVGYFRELRLGRAGDPSIHDARRAAGGPHDEALAGYLESGTVLVATGGPGVDDVLDPSRRAVAPLEIRTDGVWSWPGELAYYVATYHVALPAELVRHAEAGGWRARALTGAEVAAIAEAERAGPGDGTGAG